MKGCYCLGDNLAAGKKIPSHEIDVLILKGSWVIADLSIKGSPLCTIWFGMIHVLFLFLQKYCSLWQHVCNQGCYEHWTGQYQQHSLAVRQHDLVKSSQRELTIFL